MSGKRFSETGKRVGEDGMSTIALKEACEWHDALMDAEFKGRKDNESAARFRLSKKIGVPESYLYRLTYKRRDMRDVAGEAYRRLRQGYEAICTRVETAAAHIEREAQEIEEANAIGKGPAPMVAGMDAASRRAAE